MAVAVRSTDYGKVLDTIITHARTYDDEFDLVLRTGGGKKWMELQGDTAGVEAALAELGDAVTVEEVR